jgi:hypothetical protein
VELGVAQAGRPPSFRVRSSANPGVLLGATHRPRAGTARRSAAAPRDGGPDALVKVVPGDFGDDLEAGDRSGYFNPARHEPTDREGIERSQGAPTHGLEDRP